MFGIIIEGEFCLKKLKRNIIIIAIILIVIILTVIAFITIRKNIYSKDSNILYLNGLAIHFENPKNFMYLLDYEDDDGNPTKLFYEINKDIPAEVILSLKKSNSISSEQYLQNIKKEQMK